MESSPGNEQGSIVADGEEEEEVVKTVEVSNEKQNDPLDTLLTINLLFKGNQKESGPDLESAEVAKVKEKEEEQ